MDVSDVVVFKAGVWRVCVGRGRGQRQPSRIFDSFLFYYCCCLLVEFFFFFFFF